MSLNSDLEKAIGTLVTQFHSASSNNSGTLSPNDFKGLMSSELPNLLQPGLPLSKVLSLMGVAEGENISFKSFWILIQDLATKQFGALSGSPTGGCSCIVL